MRTVVRALLTSDHFFSVDRACLYDHEPADLVVGSVRKTGGAHAPPTQLEAQYSAWRDAYYLMAYCGQGSLNPPPNVAGWSAYYQYPQYDNLWLDTATYPARNFTRAGDSVRRLPTPNDLYQPQSRNLQFAVNLLALVGQFHDPDRPEHLWWPTRRNCSLPCRCSQVRGN
ncbi:MAG: hypothetical protein IPF41_13160 [Flavobacteriales bacterium]|nr:hypothetical protein [Flavobacteriales bacterium]